MSEQILVLNAGSSSLKFALYPRHGELTAQARGQVDGLGARARLRISAPVAESRELPGDTGLSSALELIFEWIAERADQVVAVGHRVVHGGAQFSAPLRLDQASLDALQKLISLAPLHQPHNLAPVQALRERWPGLAQIACFDTAFHASMPELATRFGLPDTWHARGLRRYGFHGLSYQYIAEWMRANAPEARRVLVAHLGNGASLCAIRDGISVDTTLGFSALDGLLMGTRCGAMDPGALLYLLRQPGMDVDALEQLLYQHSGLRGVSGISHDMRELLASDQPAARRAIDLFVYRCVREAGAMISSMGGIDTLVFTAGIGENARPIRDAIARGLHWSGLRINSSANEDNAAIISEPDSYVTVRVIPTDEESVIAAQVRDAL